MTCDIMLRLSPKMLLVVTDERATYGGRIADYSRKMTIKGPYVTTRTGRVDNAIEINRRWIDEPQKSTLKEELETFKQIFKDVYRTKLNDYANQYGMTLTEVKEGKINKELLPMFSAKAEEFLRSPNGFGTAFLFGGWNAGRADMEIYDMVPPGFANPHEHYDVMGSGEDRAQTVLSDYMEGMSPDKRDSIPLTEGLHKAMQALHAGSKNVGVGGTPDILILEPKGHSRLPYKAGRVMYNICVKEAHGEVTAADAADMFERIMSAKRRSTLEEIAEGIVRKSDPLEYLLS